MKRFLLSLLFCLSFNAMASTANLVWEARVPITVKENNVPEWKLQNNTFINKNNNGESYTFIAVEADNKCIVINNQLIEVGTVLSTPLVMKSNRCKQGKLALIIDNNMGLID